MTWCWIYQPTTRCWLERYSFPDTVFSISCVSYLGNHLYILCFPSLSRQHFPIIISIPLNSQPTHPSILFCLLAFRSWSLFLSLWKCVCIWHGMDIGFRDKIPFFYLSFFGWRFRTTKENYSHADNYVTVVTFFSLSHTLWQRPRPPTPTRHLSVSLFDKKTRRKNKHCSTHFSQVSVLDPTFKLLIHLQLNWLQLATHLLHWL